MSREEKLERELKALNETFELEEKTKKCLDETYEQLFRSTSEIRYKGAALKYASMLLVCIIGIGVFGTCHPIWAQDIPILYQLFVGLNETFFKDTPYEKYAESKALTVVDNSLEVTIEEVFCDQREFGYTYTIKSTKDKLRGDMEYHSVNSEVAIKVNGEVFEGYLRHGSGDYIDDYTYTGRNVYESLSPLSDRFELSLEFKVFETMNNEGFRVTGKWDFITVVTKHTNPYSTVARPNAKFQVKEPIGFELAVDEVGITPINTYISMKAPCEQIDEALDTCELTFTIIDDLGQVYLPKRGVMNRNEEGVHEWLLMFSVPKEMPNWFAIVPSVIPYEEEEWLPKERVTKVDYNQELPVVIQREGVGDYLINQVKQENEEVVIKAKAEALQNHSYLTLELKDGSKEIGESTIGEDGEIEWRYKNCRTDQIVAFRLSDDGEVFNLNQAINISLK